MSKLQFIVINHEEYDLLLGLDWLIQTNAVIYPALKEIRFPGDKIFLDQSYENSDNNCLLISLDEDNELPIDIEWNSFKGDFNPVMKLYKNELNLFKNMVKKWKSVFAFEINDLGTSQIAKHTIELDWNKIKQNNVLTPIHMSSYRLSLKERTELKKIIVNMEKAGVIRKSTSPWSAPLILIPKPGGTFRPCIDFRKLNSITITQSWPIPRIQDILDDLAGANVFLRLI